MPEKAWKRVERDIAARLKGSRIPSSGRARRDIDTPYPLCVEIKTRGFDGGSTNYPKWLVDVVEQAEMDALLNHEETPEIPVAILHERGWPHARDLVVLKLKYFEHLLEWLEGANLRK